MERENKTRNVKETIVYYERITEEIVEELSEEQRLDYFIWDEITRHMKKLLSEILLPVIKEVFGKEYSRNVNIEFLSKKYAVDKNRRNGVNAMHSICADLVIRVGKKDIYHFECQIAPEEDIALRTYEYDTRIAFVHGSRKRKKYKKHKKEQRTLIEMPHSLILYLTHTQNTLDFESMQIFLPNEKICEYQIPVLKVQKYI